MTSLNMTNSEYDVGVSVMRFLILQYNQENTYWNTTQMTNGNIFAASSLSTHLATQSGVSSSSMGGVKARSWVMSSLSELVERPTPWRITCMAPFQWQELVFMLKCYFTQPKTHYLAHAYALQTYLWQELTQTAQHKAFRFSTFCLVKQGSSSPSSSRRGHWLTLRCVLRQSCHAEYPPQRAGSSAAQRCQ